MDTQLYKDRMLEIDSLTDELEDSEANWLLDWGKEQLDLLLAGIDDPATASQRSNALFAIMRKINNIMAHADLAPEELSKEFVILAELAGDAYGCRPGLTAVESHSAAAHLGDLATADAVMFLARWALLSCNAGN